MSDARKVFDRIYLDKVWGDGSGGGSTPELVPEYITLINRLIATELPTRVLDLGCGFGWIARAINWRGAQYIGVDCAALAIEHIRTIMCGQFLLVDAITDTMPYAPLVIVKEVTQHLDLGSIARLIENLRFYRTVVHCSIVEPERCNSEIEMGETRGVDLSVYPFNLPCERVLQYDVAATRYQVQIWRP